MRRRRSVHSRMRESSAACVSRIRSGERRYCACSLIQPATIERDHHRGEDGDAGHPDLGAAIEAEHLARTDERHRPLRAAERIERRDGAAFDEVVEACLAPRLEDARSRGNVRRRPQRAMISATSGASSGRPSIPKPDFRSCVSWGGGGAQRATHRLIRSLTEERVGGAPGARRSRRRMVRSRGSPSLGPRTHHGSAAARGSDVNEVALFCNPVRWLQQRSGAVRPNGQ